MGKPPGYTKSHTQVVRLIRHDMADCTTYMTFEIFIGPGGVHQNAELDWDSQQLALENGRSPTAAVHSQYQLPWSGEADVDHRRWGGLEGILQGNLRRRMANVSS